MRRQFALRRELQHACVLAQTRVQHQVDQAEDAGQQEHPHPPARQWIVQFAQVVVPDVAGVVARVGGLGDLALREQQPYAPDDADERDRGNVVTPEIGKEIAHG
ncbi:hypothetical protein D9M70_614030 [compost metagenome]